VPQAELSKTPAEERAASIATAHRDRRERSSAERLPLGTRARRLQRRVLLTDHSLEGLYWVVDQYVGRPLVSLLRIVPLIIRMGPPTRRAHGISIRRQVFDLLQMVLIHGAKPWIYYIMECYRSGGMRDAGAIVMRNEVKHGLFKALNRIDPEARARARQLGDKLKVADWCAEAGIPHPQPWLVSERGEVAWRGGATRNDLDRDLFVKRREGRGAFGTTPYRRTAPFQYVDADNGPITLEQILADMVRRSQTREERDGLMLMPFLHNHPAMADLAQDTLITIRVLSCLDEQLRPVVTNAYIRSMTKLEPTWDTGQTEEYGAPIDLETGALGLLTGDKENSLSERFERHPVTGAQVVGRIVPFHRELAEIAVKAHLMVPERVMIGWDMAVTPDGPMLLEGNSFADPVFPERVFAQPLGHMRLGELLHFHMDRLEASLDQGTFRLN
jgi:hypothetical protein